MIKEVLRNNAQKTTTSWEKNSVLLDHQDQLFLFGCLFESEKNKCKNRRTLTSSRFYSEKASGATSSLAPVAHHNREPDGVRDQGASWDSTSRDVMFLFTLRDCWWMLLTVKGLVMWKTSEQTKSRNELGSHERSWMARFPAPRQLYL